MSIRELLACCVIVALSGCVYHARERTDGTVANLVSHPYDVMPPTALVPATAPAAPGAEAPTIPPTPTTAPTSAAPKTDSSPGGSAQIDVQTSKYLLTSYEENAQPGVKKFEPRIPPELPGSEAKAVEIPKGETEKDQAIKLLFPKLPPLAAEPVASVSSDGRAFTLTDLQMMAAGNSPELRQAASDVEAARGNLIQARTYPNPTTGWEMTPSNDGSTAGAQGPFIDQVIKTGGKLKLASAAAEMDLRNSELALRRARSDLATRVRNAYYALLVAKETMRVSRSLAQFTDDVYALHTGLLEAGNAASYEPMALRAQAYSVRLAYSQSIQTYMFAWKQLVAAMGMRQLPLSQVEGRIDVLIPYFDYDTVLGYVLRNHTDVLAARNTLDKAKYQLKLAQVTPVPDIDVNVALLKDYVVEPKAMVATATIGFPLPIWDQNKGNILAAESGLVRATEESHRVEMNLTAMLTTNYTNYRTSLQALDYYRNHILPDQVRAYRGVLERRQLDPNAAFSDLFGAQQTLSGFVTTYLGVLSTLWTSAVNVADLLQTDDLFQLAQPQAVPALPDLGVLLPFPCCHPSAPGTVSPGVLPYEAAAHVPQTTVAAAQPTTKPAQPTTSHAPATARLPLASPVQVGTQQPSTLQPSPSTSIDDLANAEPESVANFGTAAAATSGSVSNAGNHSPPPPNGQGIERPFQPLTCENHSAN
ncbi:MAG TPA: TolC family protein [Planctomycetaceae bacterium]|jgi:cobalt-zinc-cadmium efflux system outer membrane protein|nr:TolC family protein [Planctomycetaceae bacterium]